MTQKTVSLVLGSGGARGMAHIGIIRCLEDRGYKIVNIAGASIGALIGGFYAAGKLDKYESWVTALDRRDVLRLLDLSFDGGGLFKGDKIMTVLRKLISDAQIEDLPIEFTAVAVDIERQREVWLTEGSLFEAIRASIAIPSVFKPHYYRNMMLVDGGVLNPVPMAPTLRTTTDLTLAVNLNGREEVPRPSAPVRRKPPAKDDEKTRNAMQRAVGRFIDRWWTEDEKQDAEPQNKWGIMELINRSIDTMQNTIAHMKLAAHQPDILIEIPRSTGGLFDYNLAEDIITEGYQLCEEALQRYETKTDKHSGSETPSIDGEN